MAQWRQEKKAAEKEAREKRSEAEVPENVRRSKAKTELPDTLCWKSEHSKDEYGVAGCKYACGGCSWSNELIPVEGWEAIPTKLGKHVESYVVLKCPKYKPHRGRAFFSPQRMDTDGAEKLVQAICKKAVEDYEELPEMRSAISKFFHSEVFARLSDVNPDYIIRMVRERIKRKAAAEIRDMRL